MSDFTARARIRDAAIECFAAEGFAASFRRISERAGVSPGLITHHFRSKNALRAECDAEVLRRYRDLKSGAVDRPSAHLLEVLGGASVSATLMVYILRVIHAGGEPARELFDHVISDMRPVMAHSVETGLVRPSRDEDARLRYLSYQTLGAMLVQFLMAPSQDPEQFAASMRAENADTVLPMLELLTEGMLADRRLLDEYVQYLWEPPDQSAAVL